MIQKYEFPKMHHYVGFSQIGSHVLYKAESLSVRPSAFFLVTLWSLHRWTMDLHETKAVSSGIFQFISESLRAVVFL